MENISTVPKIEVNADFTIYLEDIIGEIISKDINYSSLEEVMKILTESVQKQIDKRIEDYLCQNKDNKLKINYFFLKFDDKTYEGNPLIVVNVNRIETNNEHVNRYNQLCRQEKIDLKEKEKRKKLFEELKKEFE